MKNLITDRRLWLTAGEDRVVEDGDPAAAFLLVGVAGRTIPADVASKLQLQIVDGRISYPGSPDFEEAEVKAEEVEAEDDGGKVLRFGEGAQEEETEEDEDVPQITWTEVVEDAEPAPDWPDRTSPETYLRRYPTGPKAELARAVIDAREAAGE